MVQLAPGLGRLPPLLVWGSVPPMPAASVRTTPSPGQGAPTGSSEANGYHAGPGLCHAVSAGRRAPHPPGLARQAACPAGEACGGHPLLPCPHPCPGLEPGARPGPAFLQLCCGPFACGQVGGVSGLQELTGPPPADLSLAKELACVGPCVGCGLGARGWSSCEEQLQA